MKKSIKIVSILMIAMMLIMTTTPVFANSITPPTISPAQPTNTDNLVTLAGKILGFLQWIAAAAAVLIIAVLGVKYMMGSLEEKAEYKKSFVPLIVGIIVVFGAVTIANLLINTFKIAG